VPVSVERLIKTPGFLQGIAKIVMNRWLVSLQQQSGIVGKDGFFVAARSAQPFCQFALRYGILMQRTLRLLVLVDSRF